MRHRRNAALGLLAVLVVALVDDARGNDQPTHKGEAPIEDAVDILRELRTESSGSWELNFGTDYSTGKYGAARATRILYTPFGISYRAGRWRLAVDSGFLRVKGPVDYASILELTAEEASGLDLDTDMSASGIADTNVSATYGIYENFDRLWFVDVGTRLRVPTANRTKGLGNGNFAGDLSVDVIKMLGTWSLFASASYGLRHREPGGRNTHSFSTGFGRSLSDATSIGVVYEWRRGPDPRTKDGRDVIGYVTRRISERVSLTGYGVRSLVSTGVEAEAGIRLTYRWP